MTDRAKPPTTAIAIAIALALNGGIGLWIAIDTLAGAQSLAMAADNYGASLIVTIIPAIGFFLLLVSGVLLLARKKSSASFFVAGAALLYLCLCISLVGGAFEALWQSVIVGGLDSDTIFFASITVIGLSIGFVVMHAVYTYLKSIT